MDPTRLLLKKLDKQLHCQATQVSLSTANEAKRDRLKLPLPSLIVNNY